MVHGSSTVEYLTREVDDEEEHYKNGFLCRPNHERGEDFLANFTVFNVTNRSVGVSWNFYEWDIIKYHLLMVKIYILQGTIEITKISMFIMGDEELYFYKHLTGLHPCTSYIVKVEGHYDSSERRTLRLHFRTRCVPVLGTVGWNVGQTVAIGGCTVVLVLSVILCALLLEQGTGMGHSHDANTCYDDIIDPKDIGV